MDKKNKIFFAVFFTLIVAVVAITFTKYFVAKDYYIEAEADCDPYTEKCFIWECDPEATDEAEKCTGDQENDISYYKIVQKKANLIPLCDPNDEDCDALSCSPGMDCEETLCDESAIEEGQQCNDPEKYTQENPVEEECAEDDEECPSAEEEEEECVSDDEECVNEEESDDGEDPDDMGVEEEENEEDSAGAQLKVNTGNFMG